jgi:hypothetical protein
VASSPLSLEMAIKIELISPVANKSPEKLHQNKMVTAKFAISNRYISSFFILIV